jgi:DNA repair exonuclease SbcCD ATPase subunit
MLAEANERLAQRSTEVADLRLLCDELKSVASATRAEASSAQEQVASQAEEMQRQRLELGQVLGELDQTQSQAAGAMSRAEALKGQLAEAVGRLAEASTRAEGMCCPLCIFVLHLVSEEYCWLSAGLETALSESVKDREALAQAAEQKEADRAAMSEAISAFCRAFDLDDVLSGSSPRVTCGPWAAMCAVDSAGRYITALGGPSPCSLPTMTWIWSGSARGTAYPKRMRPP